MTKTPPPSFPVETPSNSDDPIKVPERIHKALEEVFKKSCKGNSLNHTMVQKNENSSPNKPPILADKIIVIAWQPHNMRLYFKFKKINFVPEKPPNHALQKTKTMVPEFNPAYGFTSLNHDSEFRYIDFMKCDIRVKKTMVEVIPKSHFKQWRKMTADNPDDIEAKQMEVLKRLELEARKALRVFIDLHGGESSFEYARAIRLEDGLRGDDFLDSLPPDLVITDDLFKKVYRHKVEFNGLDPEGVLHSQKYIHSRAAEKVVPSIVAGQDQIIGEIRNIPDVISRRADPWGFMFAHAEEFNKLNREEGDKFIKEAFGL